MCAFKYVCESFIEFDVFAFLFDVLSKDYQMSLTLTFVYSHSYSYSYSNSRSLPRCWHDESMYCKSDILYVTVLTNVLATREKSFLIKILVCRITITKDTDSVWQTAAVYEASIKHFCENV